MSKDLLNTYGKGAALMMKMGYIPGTGLGEDGRGIVEPIMPSIRKRGEGIKVGDKSKNQMNMMQSIVVGEDDWSDSEEDNGNSSDDEDINMIDADDEDGIHNKNHRKSLGFEKSGIYKSEYDMPELHELVRELQDLNVEIPLELMEWVDSMDEEDKNSTYDLQIRKILWETLQNKKADLPKLKFLSFEINNISQFHDVCEKDLEILMKCYEIIIDCDLSSEFTKNKISSSVLKLKGLSEVNFEIRETISKLLASRVIDWWQGIVDECDFMDISEFGKLLDFASKYMKISETLKVGTEYFSEEDNGNIITFHFSIIGTAILKPIITKLAIFYSNWNVEKVHLGLGIFEELKDSGIMEDEVLQYLIFSRLVVPRLEEYIEKWDLKEFSHNEEKDGNIKRQDYNDSVKSKYLVLIEWICLYPNVNAMDLIKQRIFLKYYEYILINKDITNIDLKNVGLYYWLDLFNSKKDEKYKSQLKKILLFYCVKELRKGEILNKSDFKKNPTLFLSPNFVARMTLFVRRIIDFNLEGFKKVIRHEIVLPFLITYYNLLIKRMSIRREFLRRCITLFSMIHLMDNVQPGFTQVIEAVAECLHLEKVSQTSQNLKNKMKSYIRMWDRDWKTYIFKCRIIKAEEYLDIEGLENMKDYAKRGYLYVGDNEPSKGVKQLKGGIKRLVDEVVSEHNGIFKPYKKVDGRQYYLIKPQSGNKRYVYFEKNVMYSKDGWPLYIDDWEQEFVGMINKN